MTRSQFRALPLPAQFAWVLAEGMPLGYLWEQAADLQLYQLLNGKQGFFVKVGLSPAPDCVVVLHSFSHRASLEAAIVSVAARY